MSNDVLPQGDRNGWMELEEKLPENEEYIYVKYLDGSADYTVRPVSVQLTEVEFWRESMTLPDLVKADPPLEADGMITIYEIGSGKVIAEYEGLEVHRKLSQASMWEKERQLLLEMTGTMDKHPEGYEGPCLCQLCCSYGD